jgi:hypothetical protein
MLYETPSLVIIGLLLLATIAVVEAGILVGRKYGRNTWNNAHDIHTALTTAVLALMALMLAFTFSLSVTRFDLRKNLIVSEATAIQSVRNGVDYLAPQPKAQALTLLGSYLQQRIAFLEVGNDPPREREAIAKSRSLHTEMWKIATDSANYEAPDAEVRSVQYSELTEALLKLNDVSRQREAARERRVPQAALLMLFALALGSGAVLAYISGASAHPDRLATYVVLCLVCLVIYLIIDFDRPRRGLMRLDSAPLRELVT